MGRRVLVVGTTPDYIDIIRRRYPGRALFLTDPGQRQGAPEEAPDPSEEVLCDLSRGTEAAEAVLAHLARFGQTLSGVACYDCESLELASAIASGHRLPFAPIPAIRACRSKYESKRMWSEAGILCPWAEVAGTADSAAAAAERIGGPVILKPLTGAGSELVFSCAGPRQAALAFATMSRRLAEHPDTRMYKAGPGGHDPRRDVVVEEMVTGTEFSCDFLMEGEDVEVLRVAAKVMDPVSSPGTTWAYIVPGDAELGQPASDLAGDLGRAARVLGFDRGIYMVDFFMRGGRPCLLEMTPRPSGDCLPWLIRASSGLDTTGLALDLAEGRRPVLPGRADWQRLVGLRLFARSEGTVRVMDTSRLANDPAVLEVYLKRRPGHVVTLPPRDYDSRVLGHVIFRPREGEDIPARCSELTGLFGLSVEKAP